MKIKSYIIFCVMLLSYGCASHSSFTAISSKNVNVSEFKLDKSNSKGIAEGKDCQHVITFIPTGGPPNMEEALERAFDLTGTNLMLDASVDYYYFWIPYIYGQACWKVKGEVYDTYEK